MQPIKYRAWLKEEKKLGYVTKLQWLMLDSQQPEELTFEAVEVRIGLSIYIVFPDEVELMQYTGIKDKGGTEIYKGDIVTYNKDIFSVVWMERFAGFGLDAADNKPKPYKANWDGVTVIGNIYSNPELLS